MENNPRKSRALIITIIAVVVLGVVVYFLFRNGGVSLTKNSSTGTNFFPLTGTTKQKGVDTIDNNTVNNNTDTSQNNNTGTGEDNTNIGTEVGGTTPSKSRPARPLTPIPTPGGQSVVDNTPVATTGSETPKGVVPTPTPEEKPPICQINDELEYTDAEKDELADLLRQYYLIAPELKTADEVAMINADIKKNQDLIDHADILTGQCKEQKADPKYEGPKATKNNPYYGDLNIKPEFYAPTQFNDLESELNIW